MPKKNKNSSNDGNSDTILVDPARVRFQHSKIRPVFSGCGRRLEDTLSEIRQGELKPEDLPPIQIMLGPIDENGNTWYFSLNNRRLWVLKRCREEGLLTDNKISARIRTPKSKAEKERYTLANCAVEAKIIRERNTNDANKQDKIASKLDSDTNDNDKIQSLEINNLKLNDDSSSQSSYDGFVPSHKFLSTKRGKNMFDALDSD